MTQIHFPDEIPLSLRNAARGVVKTFRRNAGMKYLLYDKLEKAVFVASAEEYNSLHRDSPATIVIKAKI